MRAKVSEASEGGSEALCLLGPGLGARTRVAFGVSDPPPSDVEKFWALRDRHRRDRWPPRPGSSETFGVPATPSSLICALLEGLQSLAALAKMMQPVPRSIREKPNLTALWAQLLALWWLHRWLHSTPLPLHSLRLPKLCKAPQSSELLGLRLLPGEDCAEVHLYSAIGPIPNTAAGS